MPKKILLLIDKLVNGGAERVICLWADFLCEAGYDVTLMTYCEFPNEYKISSRVNRVNLFDSYAEYRRHLPREILLPNARPPFTRDKFSEHMLKRVVLLEQYLQKHPQDLIIPFLLTPSIIAALIEPQPQTVITQTIQNSPWDKPEQPELLAVRDWAIQKCGSVILQNVEQLPYFAQPQFAHVQTYIIHNPLHPALQDLQKTSYRPIKKILAVGRLHPQKNYPLMIETVKVLRDQYHYDCTLDIYGVGTEQEALTRLIAQNNLADRVFLRGRNDTIFPVELGYDLFLMTSHCEGMPNALLEAMGLGLPCVVTNFRTGASELIDHGHNGWIVDQATPNAIAAQIMQINDPKLLEQIGRQARHDVQRYAKPHILDEIKACFTQLTAGSH